MASRFGGAANTCPRCSKAVYFQEQVAGPGGMWHKACLTCKECRKRLDSTNLTEKDREAYCKTCYGRLFGPTGYGYGGGAGVLSTETKISALPPAPAGAAADGAPAASASPVVERVRAAQIPSDAGASLRPSSGGAAAGGAAASTSRPSSAGKFGGADTCPRCSKPVYFAEQVVGPGGIKYHKLCFKCATCGKSLDSTNVASKDTTIYCKPCHGRQFGPKGYGYGGGAGVLSTEGH
ncbi:hypothetical protein HK105_206940 [Polyrhizophydium stewartii]|uniref:LIM zinc-binding domain-containing protein n=1 Tax=Polyrhizophydium stewartii TaxID=2732419 RepID=A0ABR4N1V8_9FUNG